MQQNTQIPLDYYLAIGLINEDQHWAGEKLKQSFINSGLQITSGLDVLDQKPGCQQSDTDSLQEYYDALAPLTRKQADICQNICCFDAEITRNERNVTALHDGLDVLVLYYEGKLREGLPTLQQSAYMFG